MRDLKKRENVDVPSELRDDWVRMFKPLQNSLERLKRGGKMIWGLSVGLEIALEGGIVVTRKEDGVRSRWDDAANEFILVGSRKATEAVGEQIIATEELIE